MPPPNWPANAIFLAISGINPSFGEYHRESRNSATRKRMRNRQNHWTRRLAALVCLLAVLLLQAPFARAAWLSSSMGCCMSDHCPIPGHHHKNAPAKDDMPMDCGHGMKHQADCKISCYKTTDETSINIAQFVLPDAQPVLSSHSVSPDVSRFVAQLIPRSEKPQSPPPKNLLS